MLVALKSNDARVREAFQTVLGRSPDAEELKQCLPLLTGQPPFPGGTPLQKLLQHQQADPLVERMRQDIKIDLVLRQNLVHDTQGQEGDCAKFMYGVFASTMEDNVFYACPRGVAQAMHAQILLLGRAHDRHIHLCVLQIGRHLSASHRDSLDARIAQFKEYCFTGDLANHFRNPGETMRFHGEHP